MSVPPPARRLLTKVRGGSDSSIVVQPLMKAPAEAYKTVLTLGIKKANQPASKILLLGLVAGMQVGIGAAMAVATLGGVPLLQEQNPALAKVLFGIVGLPCSLLLVVATGSELFTGNTAMVGTAFFEGKVSRQQLAKSWGCSYLGNLLGASFLAILCNYAGVFSQAAGTFTAVADAKASLPFGVAVARGIVCNWLVCSAVWCSTAAADLVSKAVAILMIITIFAALGFEHSIANMFVGPFGALQKSSRTSFLKFFFKNLVPVTIGNIIGGSLLMAGTQHLAFGGKNMVSPPSSSSSDKKRE
ncbi:formate nitrite transporter [Nannochloropsis oceanica]